MKVLSVEDEPDLGLAPKANPEPGKVCVYETISNHY